MYKKTGSVRISTAISVQITDLLRHFENNSTFDNDISCWNTSLVTTMKVRNFYKMISFLKNSQIKYFSLYFCLIILHTYLNNYVQSMFNGAVMFNGDLTFWKTFKVTDMDVSLFYVGTSILVSSQANLYLKLNSFILLSKKEMFFDAISFNGNVSRWEMSNVKTSSVSFFIFEKIFLCLRDTNTT